MFNILYSVLFTVRIYNKLTQNILPSFRITIIAVDPAISSFISLSEKQIYRYSIKNSVDQGNKPTEDNFQDVNNYTVVPYLDERYVSTEILSHAL